MYSKKKVAFLLDKSNDWISLYKVSLLKILNLKFKSKIFYDQKKIINYDVVFILGYTKILKDKFLKKNKLCTVIHESNLPKFRGFAPLQWQILKNKNKIDVCLIKCSKKVDSGKIILKKKINLNGTELYDEIRKKQFNTTLNLIKKFLSIYPNFKLSNQKGVPSYYRKRNPEDSKLNINLSIKKQFNLLRISNNRDWPSFFYYKKKKYYIQIKKTL